MRKGGRERGRERGRESERGQKVHSTRATARTRERRDRDLVGARVRANVRASGLMHQ